MEKWPEVDEWGTPTEKMPNCPDCEEDELGLIRHGYIMCYACGFEAWDNTKGKRGKKADYET